MRIKGILINAKEAKVEVKEIEDELDVYYDILDCDCIDICHRRICGKYFAIVCDDEGLLNRGSQISAYDTMNVSLLVGNLFVCTDRDDGYLHSLDEEDIDLILARISHYRKKDGSVHPVLDLD